MRAMVLAAGYGTRLRPLTDTLPKALVPVGGKPLLGILLDALLSQGFQDIAVNTHHHAGQVERFITNYTSGKKLKIRLSREKNLLDTGGGIKRMCDLFKDGGPVLVHNVDVLSSIDLAAMFRAFRAAENSALLAVLRRATPRSLVFDTQLELCGKAQGDTKNIVFNRRPAGGYSLREFCGIQVISPGLFTGYPGEKFSSIDVYLKAALRPGAIKGYAADGFYWRDVGRFEDLEAAQNDLKAGKWKIPGSGPAKPLT